MESELTQGLVERYRRMDARYRALGERLRAALGKRNAGPDVEAEKVELFSQLQELQAKIDEVRLELCQRNAARPNFR